MASDAQTLFHSTRAQDAAEEIDEAVGPGAVPGRMSMHEPETLFLTHTGRIGGAEVCLLNIVQVLRGNVLLFQDGPLYERLRAQGAQVALPRTQLDLRGVRRDRGLLRVLPVLIVLVGLVRHIARAAATHDLVYCNSQKSFVLGALASCLNRKPLVWHLHDILDASHFGRAQIHLVVTLANRRAARVIAPSRSVADAFVAAGGRRTLVVVVPNGVAVPPEPQAAAPDRESRIRVRRELGLPEGFLFGVFSRLTRWKGQHVALEALAQLEDASCIIVGDALFGEQDYARSLRVKAADLGIADRVRFLGQRDDVASLMRAVDVVVHPSIDPEPFGLTLVEAMLAGTPVVASRTGAAGEILDEGRMGELVPPGDAAALAAAIERCRGLPQAVARQAAAARHHAESHFTSGHLQHAIRQVLAELVRPRDARRQPQGAAR